MDEQMERALREKHMGKTPYLDTPMETTNTVSYSKPTLKELFQGGMSPSFIAKLPEWVGFWFKHYDTVFVFTKDNLLLNSPDYDKFGDRKDWLEIENNSYYHFELAKRFVRAMRVRLDEIYQRFDKLPKTREVASAKTGVQTGFMFLGLELAHLGSGNPYPESMNASNSIIENPQDKWDGKKSILTTEHVSDEKQIEFTKWLRLELQFTLDAIKSYQRFIRPSNNSSLEISNHLNLGAVIIEVTKGKLWAGQQLNNFNEEIKAKEEEEAKIKASNSLSGEGTANRKVAKPVTGQ